MAISVGISSYKENSFSSVTCEWGTLVPHSTQHCNTILLFPLSWSLAPCDRNRMVKWRIQVSWSIKEKGKDKTFLYVYASYEQMQIQSPWCETFELSWFLSSCCAKLETVSDLPADCWLRNSLCGLVHSAVTEVLREAAQSGKGLFCVWSCWGKWGSWCHCIFPSGGRDTCWLVLSSPSFLIQPGTPVCSFSTHIPHIQGGSFFLG